MRLKVSRVSRQSGDLRRNRLGRAAHVPGREGQTNWQDLGDGLPPSALFLMNPRIST